MEINLGIAILIVTLLIADIRIQLGRIKKRIDNLEGKQK